VASLERTHRVIGTGAVLVFGKLGLLNHHVVLYCFSSTRPSPPVLWKGANSPLSYNLRISGGEWPVIFWRRSARQASKVKAAVVTG
jgi:hypothetical protein